jgi:serine/threonine-protein kinase
MRVRLGAGVGAWIVGAATATGLCLFAVSYLEQDPHSSQGTTLSQDEVDQALASMTGTSGSSAATAVPTTDSATSSGPASGAARATPSTQSSTTKPSQTKQPTQPAQPTGPTPGTTTPVTSPQSSLSAQPVERSLSNDAGTVVAQCQGSTVYVVTWSPAQGYQAVVPERGPARTATVVFIGYGHHVAFHIGCQAGAPVLVDDDGDDH